MLTLIKDCQLEVQMQQVGKVSSKPKISFKQYMSRFASLSRALPTAELKEELKLILADYANSEISEAQKMQRMTEFLVRIENVVPVVEIMDPERRLSEDAVLST